MQYRNIIAYCVVSITASFCDHAYASGDISYLSSILQTLELEMLDAAPIKMPPISEDGKTLFIQGLKDIEELVNKLGTLPKKTIEKNLLELLREMRSTLQKYLDDVIKGYDYYHTLTNAYPEAKNAMLSLQEDVRTLLTPNSVFIINLSELVREEIKKSQDHPDTPMYGYFILDLLIALLRITDGIIENKSMYPLKCDAIFQEIMATGLLQILEEGTIPSSTKNVKALINATYYIHALNRNETSFPEAILKDKNNLNRLIQNVPFFTPNFFTHLLVDGIKYIKLDSDNADLTLNEAYVHISLTEMEIDPSGFSKLLYSRLLAQAEVMKEVIANVFKEHKTPSSDLNKDSIAEHIYAESKKISESNEEFLIINNVKGFEKEMKKIIKRNIKPVLKKIKHSDDALLIDEIDEIALTIWVKIATETSESFEILLKAFLSKTVPKIYYHYIKNIDLINYLEALSESSGNFAVPSNPDKEVQKNTENIKQYWESLRESMKNPENRTFENMLVYQYAVGVLGKAGLSEIPIA